MISDERLREMLEAAAEGYPVPPDGAERILTLAVGPEETPQAELDPYEIQRRRHRWRVIAGSGIAASVVAVLIAAAVLTGGGGGGNRSSSSSAGSDVARGASSGSSSAASAPKEAAPVAPLPQANSNAQGSAPNASEAAPAQPSVQPRIIQTGEASLQVRQGQVPAALSKLQSLATSLGGPAAASNARRAGPTPPGR